jgi:hypothetical protein
MTSENQNKSFLEDTAESTGEFLKENKLALALIGGGWATQKFGKKVSSWAASKDLVPSPGKLGSTVKTYVTEKLKQPADWLGQYGRSTWVIESSPDKVTSISGPFSLFREKWGISLVPRKEGMVSRWDLAHELGHATSKWQRWLTKHVAGDLLLDTGVGRLVAKLAAPLTRNRMAGGLLGVLAMAPRLAAEAEANLRSIPYYFRLGGKKKWLPYVAAAGSMTHYLGATALVAGGTALLAGLSKKLNPPPSSVIPQDHTFWQEEAGLG